MLLGDRHLARRGLTGRQALVLRVDYLVQRTVSANVAFLRLHIMAKGIDDFVIRNVRQETDQCLGGLKACLLALLRENEAQTSCTKSTESNWGRSFWCSFRRTTRRMCGA